MTSLPQWLPIVTDGYVQELQLPLKYRIMRWIGHQAWIPKGRDFLLRLFHDPEANKHFNFEIDFFGQRYRGDLGHFIDWSVFCYGAHAYNELALLRDIALYLKELQLGSISIYDVGANIGHHTLFMAPRVDKVIAFEPFPLILPLMEEKLSLNKIANVALFPIALGETDGTAKYFPAADSNSGAGTLVENRPGKYGSPVDVQIRRGESFLDARNLPKIDILKVDVEGFEASVLRGLAGRIRRDRPAIITEMSHESRIGFGSKEAFAAAFYENSLICGIHGRNGRTYKLKRFDYETAREVLILPPEMSALVKRLGAPA